MVFIPTRVKLLSHSSARCLRLANQANAFDPALGSRTSNMHRTTYW